MNFHLLVFYCLIIFKYINLSIKENLALLSTLKIASNQQTVNIHFRDTISLFLQKIALELKLHFIHLIALF